MPKGCVAATADEHATLQDWARHQMRAQAHGRACHEFPWVMIEGASREALELIETQ